MRVSDFVQCDGFPCSGVVHENYLVPDIDLSLFRSAAKGNEVAMVGPTGTILISTDGGKTFQDKTDKDHFSFAGVAAHPDGGFICVGAFGKIYRVPGSGNKQKED